jgi:hypothetical protein
MYQDWKHQKEDERYYGLTVPYEPPQAQTPAPQAIQPLATIYPLPPIEDVEDFAAEDFVTNAVRSPEVERLVGQDALEVWAAETEPMRQGKTIPTIHRHSNTVLRETQLEEVTCPNCRMTFKP